MVRPTSIFSRNGRRRPRPVRDGQGAEAPLPARPLGEKTRELDAAARRTSRGSRVLTGLLVAGGVLMLLTGVTARVADLHFQTVLSNSMQPTASAGDVAITQAVAIDSIRVGDVIAFYAPQSSRPVLHRVTSLQDGVITTRGDANPVDDPWRVTLRGTKGYRLIAVVPFVGWLTELQRPALLAAGLLVGLAILLELWKEVRARATRSQPRTQS